MKIGFRANRRQDNVHERNHNPRDRSSDDEELQEAIRRSLNDSQRPPPYNPDYYNAEYVREARIRRLAHEN